MYEQDIRWQQRFSNYKKAVAKVREVIENEELEHLTDLEKEGLIQRFEYTYELAWKTLQDLLRFKGYVDIAGPTPVLQQSLKDGYITDESNWRKMKKSRELTSHTYDSDTAQSITASIWNTYASLLFELEKRLDEESTKNP